MGTGRGREESQTSSCLLKRFIKENEIGAPGLPLDVLLFFVFLPPGHC
jgi:hypothetical protein